MALLPGLRLPAIAQTYLFIKNPLGHLLVFFDECKRRPPISRAVVVARHRDHEQRVFRCEDVAGARKLNRIGLWCKPWFYKHVETFLEKGIGDAYIPLAHDLMRHNRRSSGSLRT
jgi:hypothetical protein